MEDLDPLKLDRALFRTATEWRRWRRGLDSADLTSLPAFELNRWAIGLSCFQRVLELHPADPLRGPLGRWVYRLTEQRVNQRALLIREHRLRREIVQIPSERSEMPLSQLKQALLLPAGGRAERLAKRPGRLGALARHGGNYRTASLLVWERRQEFAQRMGLSSPDSIELPCEAPELLASRWLTESQDAWLSTSTPDLNHAIELGVDARDDHGWPARLSPASLQRLLSEGDLFRSLDLDPGELPQALGGSSFLRAMARVGAAWHDAASPKDQPFVIAHDPYGLRRREVGARFAMLALNPAFATHKLRLSGPRLEHHLRATQRTLLLESRIAALRVLLRKPALTGATAFNQAFEEYSALVFGEPLDARLSATLFSLHVDDVQRFCGLFLAAASSAALREAHDFDWFRNPRGIDQVRADAAIPPRHTLDAEQGAAGLDALKQLLAS